MVRPLACARGLVVFDASRLASLPAPAGVQFRVFWPRFNFGRSLVFAVSSFFAGSPLFVAADTFPLGGLSVSSSSSFSPPCALGSCALVILPQACFRTFRIFFVFLRRLSPTSIYALMICYLRSYSHSVILLERFARGSIAIPPPSPACDLCLFGWTFLFVCPRSHLFARFASIVPRAALYADSLSLMYGSLFLSPHSQFIPVVLTWRSPPFVSLALCAISFRTFFGPPLPFPSFLVLSFALGPFGSRGRSLPSAGCTRRVSGEVPSRSLFLCLPPSILFLRYLSHWFKDFC